MNTGNQIILTLLAIFILMLIAIFSPLFLYMMGCDVVEEEVRPPVITEYEIDVGWWKEWNEY